MCVTLKPQWSKGWARLGAAHVGLQEWSEAKEAFGKAMELEPDEHALQRAWEQVRFATPTLDCDLMLCA